MRMSFAETPWSLLVPPLPLFGASKLRDNCLPSCQQNPTCGKSHVSSGKITRTICSGSKAWEFSGQVHFHITHYPPLNLVLNVNFGSRWTKREIIFQEHLLILLCSQIHTDSDNLHSNETWRARQCPQVFICHHPLLSSWVEFNYPTTLGVAMPDVRCWPRHFKQKDLVHSRESSLGKQYSQ